MLIPADVKQIRRLYEDGWTVVTLASRYHVSVPTIWRIVAGRTWADVTGGSNLVRTRRNTEYRRAYIESRLDQGCRNLSLIAQELGISPQAVRNLITTQKLGEREC